jgi:cyclopropane-fatty-acyl-phospholipid synthase
LSDRVEFVEDDYRNISSQLSGRYDAFVSVGMLEHVGVENYRSSAR